MAWLRAKADRVIETHIAAVFLIGDHAYKLKKAVDLGFLDFTTSDKLALIPPVIKEDLNEAVLYAYFAVRYFDDHIFKVIQTRTNHFAGD